MFFLDQFILLHNVLPRDFIVSSSLFHSGDNKVSD